MEGIGIDVIVVICFSALVFFILIYYLYEKYQMRQNNNNNNDNNNDNIGQRRPRDSNDECSICLEQFNFKVETNCSHLFCGNCIIDYWRNSVYPRILHCPLCRQPITILIYNEDELNDNIENTQISRHIDAYNARYSRDRTLAQQLMQLPVLLRHFWYELIRRPSLVFWTVMGIRKILITIGAVLYILLPFDIIPEAIFGIFGLIDDIFCVVIMLLILAAAFRDHYLRHARRQNINNNNNN